MASRFIHLHTHSHYSFLQALPKIDELVAKAKKEGMDALALTDTKRSRIVLLAENNEGYKNLLALVTKSWTEGFFERPRLDKELLREHHRGLIALLPSFAGDVAQLLRAGDPDGATAA